MVVDENSVTCSGQQNIKSSASCEFDSDTQLLTMSNAFSRDLSSGTTVIFTFDSIRNPISTKSMIGFVVTTGDTDSGFIDSSTARLSVSTPAAITTMTVSADSYTVQEYTQYTINFDIPVPLLTGCLIDIIFPPQIILDSSLTSSQGSSFFGAERDLVGFMDTAGNLFEVTDGCPTYMRNNLPAQVTLSLIPNPFYEMTTTDVFSIYIYDESRNPICEIGFGPTFTTTPNSIIVNSVASDNTEVNALASLQFSLQPLSDCLAGGRLVMEVPSEFTMPSECSLTPLSLVSSSSSCSISGQTLTFEDFFSSDYSYSSSLAVQFEIAGFQMPPSVAPTSDFSFTFYTSWPDDSFQLVDTATSTNALQATQGYFPYADAVPSSYTANDVGTYRVEFVIANPLLLES